MPGLARVILYLPRLTAEGGSTELETLVQNVTAGGNPQKQNKRSTCFRIEMIPPLGAFRLAR